MDELTEEEIDEIGEALEHGGFSDEDIDDYLAHHGVKGMKWGRRRELKRGAKFQRRTIDPLRRVAEGNGGKLDKTKAALTLSVPNLVKGRGLKGGAQLQLENAQRTQAKIESGGAKVHDYLSRYGGINMRDIDYSFKKSA